MQSLKVCPHCGASAALSSAVCGACGHRYRTHFYAPPEQTLLFDALPRMREVSPLWMLLFGCFYLFKKGYVTAAFVWILLAISTLGLTWLVLPLFARKFVEGCEGRARG